MKGSGGASLYDPIYWAGSTVPRNGDPSRQENRAIHLGSGPTDPKFGDNIPTSNVRKCKEYRRPTYRPGYTPWNYGSKSWPHPRGEQQTEDMGEFPQWGWSKWHRIRGVRRKRFRIRGIRGVRFSFINLYSIGRFDPDVGERIWEFKLRLPLKHEFHKLKEVYLVTRTSRQTESAQKTLHLYTLALSNPTITPTPHQ